MTRILKVFVQLSIISVAFGSFISKRKRETPRDSESVSLECSGSTSSSCVGKHCLVACQDGNKVELECVNENVNMNSNLVEGKNHIKVSCGVKLPDCFPLCDYEVHNDNPTEAKEEDEAGSKETETNMKSETVLKPEDSTTGEPGLTTNHMKVDEHDAKDPAKEAVSSVTDEEIDIEYLSPVKDEVKSEEESNEDKIDEPVEEVKAVSSEVEPLISEADVVVEDKPLEETQEHTTEMNVKDIDVNAMQESALEFEVSNESEESAALGSAADDFVSLVCSRLTSSQCEEVMCSVRCSDGHKVELECESGSVQIKSDIKSRWKVSCGSKEDLPKFEPCYPFCATDTSNQDESEAANATEDMTEEEDVEDKSAPEEPAVVSMACTGTTTTHCVGKLCTVFCSDGNKVSMMCEGGSVNTNTNLVKGNTVIAASCGTKADLPHFPSCFPFCHTGGFSFGHHGQPGLHHNHGSRDHEHYGAHKHDELHDSLHQQKRPESKQHGSSLFGNSFVNFNPFALFNPEENKKAGGSGWPFGS